MNALASHELAEVLRVSRSRVGQYVREGKLAGCFVGAGRARRFDLEKVGVALGRKLHPGQMLGNGAGTKQALLQMDRAAPNAQDRTEVQPVADEVADTDTAKYTAARTQKAEEEVRKLRRANAEAEGKYVLASAVAGVTAKLMAQEIGEVESLLRRSAQRVADAFGLDVKPVRKILLAIWREHRGARAAMLKCESDASELTAEELSEDI